MRKMFVFSTFIIFTLSTAHAMQPNPVDNSLWHRLNHGFVKPATSFVSNWYQGVSTNQQYGILGGMAGIATVSLGYFAFLKNLTNKKPEPVQKTDRPKAPFDKLRLRNETVDKARDEFAKNDPFYAIKYAIETTIEKNNGIWYQKPYNIIDTALSTICSDLQKAGVYTPNNMTEILENLICVNKKNSWCYSEILFFKYSVMYSVTREKSDSNNPFSVIVTVDFTDKNEQCAFEQKKTQNLYTTLMNSMDEKAKNERNALIDAIINNHKSNSEGGNFVS
jgi:hypothetical protein